MPPFTPNHIAVTVLGAVDAHQIGDWDMSDNNKNEKVESADPARREALIKIGKYAAYTAPAMMVTIGTAKAGNGGPSPTSGPSPTP